MQVADKLWLMEHGKGVIVGAPEDLVLNGSFEEIFHHSSYEFDKEYPMYDLKNNKGYGTKKHLEAIKEYGITKYHRLSYKPLFDSKDRINNYVKAK